MCVRNSQYCIWPNFGSTMRPNRQRAITNSNQYPHATSKTHLNIKNIYYFRVAKLQSRVCDRLEQFLDGALQQTHIFLGAFEKRSSEVLHGDISFQTVVLLVRHGCRSVLSFLRLCSCSVYEKKIVTIRCLLKCLLVKIWRVSLLLVLVACRKHFGNV